MASSYSATPAHGLYSVEDHTFPWIITELSSRRSGGYIRSPRFNCGPIDFHLDLNLNPIKASEPRHAALAVYLLSDGTRGIMVHLQLTMADQSEKKDIILVDKMCCQRSGLLCYLKDIEVWKHFADVKSDDDVLRLSFKTQCRIMRRSTLEMVTLMAPVPVYRDNTYRSWYLDEDCCDVLLRVGEQEVPASKHVLSSRSPIFARIFEHDFKLHRSDDRVLNEDAHVLELHDVDGDILEEFLWYIYSGELCNASNEFCLKLYEVAYRYLLPNLRRLCVRYLKDHLKAEVPSEVLKLAEEYDDQELLAFVKRRECPSEDK